MKKLKFLILFSFVLLSGFLLFLQKTKAQENTNLNTLLAEFEADKIKAQDLNIEEPVILPGESGYWWQSLKENTGLFFTFNEEKRAEKIEKLASRRLLEAQKLSEKNSTNADENIQKALEKYQDLMINLGQKLTNNPELEEKLLEKFDANQLRHQEILSSVIEKLKNKAGENQIQDLEKIKKENALNWYKVNKEKLQTRLEKSVEKNNSGSKFRQIKNITILEELEDNLPDEASEKVEAAKKKAEEKLAEKINQLTNEEKNKLEQYIKNIKTPEMVKQKMINNLQESSALPQTVKDRLQIINSQYAQNLKKNFSNLDNDQQKKFLEQFEKRTHPIYLEFLDSIQTSQEMSASIEKLREIQQEQIREKIQKTNDPLKLEAFEKKLENYPALKRQIQEQQQKILPQIAPNISQ